MAEVETERECRICRGEHELVRPLLHPCLCSGSIKYTHEDCLVNWLAQSGSARCELCNHSFRFEPLYQPNTPSALPTREFLLGVLALLKKTIKTAARIVLVFMVWLFFLPIGTCWTWYALFINSPMQLPALLASRGPSGIVTDAFYGFLLSAGIVFVFLGVSSLREYVRHLPHEPGQDEDRGFVERMLDNDEDVPPDAQPDDANANVHGWLDLNNGIRARIPVDEPHPNRLARDGIIQLAPEDDVDDIVNLNGELVDEVDDFMRDTYGVFAADAHNNNDNNNDGDDLGFESDQQSYISENDDDMIGYPAGESDGYASSSNYMEDDDFDEETLLHPNAEENQDEPEEGLDQHNEDHPHQPEEDEAEARGEGGALFGLFELDPDEVPLEEVIGLRGRIRNLFDNAGTVLVSNAIFLGIFTLIPLLIGRLTLRLFSTQSPPVRFSDISGSLPLQLLLTALIQTSDSAKSAGRSVHNVSALFKGESTRSPAIEDTVSPSHLATQSIKLFDSYLKQYQRLGYNLSVEDEPLVSYGDDLLIVLVGYGIIALVAVGYIGVISLLRHRYPRLDSPITRQVARMLRYVATFIKIVVLILFEFGIFPLGCGWWLDICTLELFGGTTQSRFAYCRDSPWTCTGGHWIWGIFYMTHISLFISLLRDVIRPEILWFLRNPDDPEFHPFRELVEKPLSRHARRMCLSVFIYVPLIIALVYVPGQLCLKLLPHVFPFRSEDFSHILIDVPFGNLLIGPLIRLLYFGRPELSLQKLISIWIHFVSGLLGIKDLVVKGRNENGNPVAPNNRGGDIPGMPPGNVGPLHRMLGPQQVFDFTDETDQQSDSCEDDDPLLGDGDRRRFIGMRAAVMVFAAWVAMVLAESSLIAMPTILGRWLMSAVGLPVRHDLHPFLLGLNVLLGSTNGFFKLKRYFGTMDTMTMISLGMPYLVLVGKGVVLVSVWLGGIPLVTGLLFELILVPVRVSYNETPYFCLHQDWALGLLLLKVCSCIAATGGLGAKWKERVLRAREGDLAGLDHNFSRTMKEVILPVLTWALTALCVPYSLSRGILPFFGVSVWFSDMVYRYAYLVVACLYCTAELIRYSVSVLRDLHDSIRDDKYLMGKRLYNFSDMQEDVASNSPVLNADT